jgi:hypothetical protein
LAAVETEAWLNVLKVIPWQPIRRLL